MIQYWAVRQNFDNQINLHYFEKRLFNSFGEIMNVVEREAPIFPPTTIRWVSKEPLVE